MKDIMPVERIENKILLIRGQKVMIDRDLAELYGVETKYLIRQVKRNVKRFPEEFMFRLTKREKEELVTNWRHLGPLKYSYQLPMAFTEHGVAMLASVLNSGKAIGISIFIIKTFIRLRQILSSHKELAKRMDDLERRMAKNEIEVKQVFDAIRELMQPPDPQEKKIGFLR